MRNGNCWVKGKRKCCKVLTVVVVLSRNFIYELASCSCSHTVDLKNKESGWNMWMVFASLFCTHVGVCYIRNTYQNVPIAHSRMTDKCVLYEINSEQCGASFCEQRLQVLWTKNQMMHQFSIFWSWSFTRTIHNPLISAHLSQWTCFLEDALDLFRNNQMSIDWDCVNCGQVIQNTEDIFDLSASFLFSSLFGELGQMIENREHLGANKKFILSST